MTAPSLFPRALSLFRKNGHEAAIPIPGKYLPLHLPGIRADLSARFNGSFDDAKGFVRSKGISALDFTNRL